MKKYNQEKTYEQLANVLSDIAEGEKCRKIKIKYVENRDGVITVDIKSK